MIRRKPAADRKDIIIAIRVTVAQQKKLAAAARRAGLSLSGWMLSTGLKAAEPKVRRLSAEEIEDSEHGGERICIG